MAMNTLDFVYCDGCRNKGPDELLCVGCIANRNTIERLKNPANWVLAKCEYDPDLMHDLECNEKALGDHRPNIYSRAIAFIRYLQDRLGKAMRQNDELRSTWK